MSRKKPARARHAWPLLRALAACALLLPKPSSAAATLSPQPNSRLSSIRSVLDAQGDEQLQLFNVRGTVTRVSGRIALQDQTGAIEAEPRGAVMAEVGDEIEVTGRLQVRGDTRVLTDASLQDLWHSSPPPPLALQPDEAANGEHNDALVQVEGRLLRVAEERGGIRLQMEGGHQFFTAELTGVAQLPAAERKRMINLPASSIVRLVGVLSLRAQNSSSDGSFSLLLRQPADVDVIKGPPWGTSTHIAELIVVLLALGGAAQYMHMRTVRRQFRAILAERARIARDVHDTLAQGFAGIALQLEVVRGGLVRDPVSAEAHLRTALGMVRHCRAEAHRSISSLRAFSQAVPLKRMLSEMVASVTGASRATVHVHFQELASEPPQAVAEQIFRICQEAVANAVQHASASSISVVLRNTGGALELEVCDDGVGFDVASAYELQVDHFGLLGMRERAAQLGATWDLTSRPGHTRVHVRVPAPLTAARRGHRWFRIRSAGPESPLKREEVV